MSNVMSKSRKQILQELLDLENDKVEEVEEVPKMSTNIDISSKENEIQNENPHSITRAKKPRTEKQLEAFDKAKAIRDANTLKRKEEARLLAEQERKVIEEKLIKKAISLKKKQIKKQAVLDELSDDDTPIEKVKEIAEKVKSKETKVFSGAFAPAPPSLTNKSESIPVRTSLSFPADKPIMKYTFF